MKIIVNNLDHKNTNYTNCLKKSIIDSIKTDSDVILFNQVLPKHYEYILDNQFIQKFYSYDLPDNLMYHKPYGFFILMKESVKDSIFEPNLSLFVSFTKKYIIAHCDSINDKIINYVKQFDKQGTLIIIIDHYTAVTPFNISIKLDITRKKTDTSEYESTYITLKE
jgi:hypothetical protein